MKKERDSGVELLRLLAMALVILVHAFQYGGFFSAASAVGGSVRAAAILAKIASRSAVSIFVLITGYFMVHTSFDLKKQYRRAGKTYLTILFYSVMLTLLFLCLGKDYLYYGNTVMPTAKIILRALFPVSAQQWYFLTDYLLLCLLAPFLNLAVQKLSQKQYAVLTAVLIWLFSGWMTLAYVAPFSRWFVIYGYNDMTEGKNVLFFAFLYLLGGYIGRFGRKREQPQLAYLVLAAGTLLVNYLLYTRLPKDIGYRDTAMKYSNVFVLLFAVALLLFFKDWHFRCKPVNLLASTTLGIYAIHEFCFVRNQLWTWFNFKEMDCSNLFLNAARLVGVIAAVMLVCGAVDFLRQKLFAKAACMAQKRKKKKIVQRP